MSPFPISEDHDFRPHRNCFTQNFQSGYGDRADHGTVESVARDKFLKARMTTDDRKEDWQCMVTHYIARVWINRVR